MESETPAELKARLTPLQFEVTQNDGTEKPFSNPYDKNYEDGIYVDIIDGTPLFSSTTKYDSKTGWPSFTSPISMDNIETPEDNTFFMTRTEVVGAKSGSHIGHIFEDGPEETGGLRYCLNSASLVFIPKDEMESRGYGEFSSLFQ
ncbi:peptide-methionine (R)-S-oxide reductase MsrB [Candidatus Gracilibacteria bacterium]|nr:peptide-methionine (R)-S-oxide reductase MsrB [Candidatus Gracilibacteria bacterium]